MADENTTDAELPLDTVGRRLRNAREAAGLSRSDIAARTKIAERHLAAIEEDRLGDLASRTYAVGFARSYARAVGLNEKQIVEDVRAELASSGESWEPAPVPTFEPGDPARVPPARVAWIAALVAIAVIAVLWFAWRSFLSPAVSLPDINSDQAKVLAAPAPANGAAAVQTPIPAGGVVTFTALEDAIWVKFYDADFVQLMQKQMLKGEQFTVPATAKGPLLWTARPDALAITIGGRTVPRLAEKPVTMKDVPVSAAALIARPPAPVAPVPLATQGMAVPAAN